MLSVIPSCDDEWCLSYTAVLTVENGVLTSCSRGASVLDWGNGCYDVHFSSPRLPFRHSPRVLRQSGVRSLATLYDDGDLHLMIEGPCFFTHDLPKLNSYELKTSERGEFLTYLRGKTEQKEYFLVLSSKDDGCVLHEHLCDEVEVQSDCVVTTERRQDMKSRKIITRHRAGGEVVSREFSRVERSFPAELIPYAMLEAVQAGDEEDALQYLAPDLRDFSSVCAFFGKFEEITHPRVLGLPLSAVALVPKIQGFCRPLILDFTVENGVITSVKKSD